MNTIVTKRLPNGLTVCVEQMTSVRSVGASIALPAALAVEPENLSGLASIIEEMLLRGAAGNDSRSVADAFDRLGATRSIDVGDRFTRFAATFLPDNLEPALGLVLDTARHPNLDEHDLEPSRELASAALASLADDPRERAAVSARSRHYPPPFNRSSHGTPEGINATRIDHVRTWWRDHAGPQNAILALAGRLDPEATIDLVERLTEGWTGGADIPGPTTDGPRGYDHITDASNQVQILLLEDAPKAPDERTSLCHRVLYQVLSGGMSSRLFTEVREKRGLCYAVSASYRPAKHFGTTVAYVGTTPERAQQSLDVLASELERARQPEGSVTRPEFDRAIAGMKSNVVFHGESTSARAAALVSDIDRLGRPRTLEEVTDAIDRLSIDEVNAHAASFRPNRPTIQTLGPAPLDVPAILP